MVNTSTPHSFEAQEPLDRPDAAADHTELPPTGRRLLFLPSVLSLFLGAWAAISLDVGAGVEPRRLNGTETVQVEEELQPGVVVALQYLAMCCVHCALAWAPSISFALLDNGIINSLSYYKYEPARPLPGWAERSKNAHINYGLNIGIISGLTCAAAFLNIDVSMEVMAIFYLRLAHHLLMVSNVPLGRTTAFVTSVGFQFAIAGRILSSDAMGAPSWLTLSCLQCILMFGPYIIFAFFQNGVVNSATYYSKEAMKALPGPLDRAKAAHINYGLNIGIMSALFTSACVLGLEILPFVQGFFFLRLLHWPLAVSNVPAGRTLSYVASVGCMLGVANKIIATSTGAELFVALSCMQCALMFLPYITFAVIDNGLVNTLSYYVYTPMKPFPPYFENMKNAHINYGLNIGIFAGLSGAALLLGLDILAETQTFFVCRLLHWLLFIVQNSIPAGRTVSFLTSIGSMLMIAVKILNA